MKASKRSGIVVIGGGACMLALLAAPGFAQHTPAKAPVKCEHYAIGTSSLLRDGRKRPMFLDMPASVQVAHGVALFAAHTMLWRNEKAFVDTAGMIEEAKAGKRIIMDTIGGALLAPSGVATTFGVPQGLGKIHSVAAVTDGRSGAWVVWLSGPDTAIHPLDVWIAHYRNEQWEQLEHAAHFTHIFPGSLSIARPSNTGAPLIVLGGADRDISGLAILRRDGTRWNSTWLKDVWSPFHVEIAQQDAHRYTLAFLGTSAPPRPDVDSNSVWISQSTDTGRTWSTLRTVDRNWGLRANWLQLRVADSSLHLLWMVDSQGSRTSRVVHATSTNGGVSFARAHEQSHPALRALASMANARGLTYITQNLEEDKLALVDLRSNESPAVMPLPWQKTELPLSATTLGESSDSVFVTWGTTFSGAYPMFPGLGAPATSYAWLTPCHH